MDAMRGPNLIIAIGRKHHLHPPAARFPAHLPTEIASISARGRKPNGFLRMPDPMTPTDLMPITTVSPARVCDSFFQLIAAQVSRYCGDQPSVRMSFSLLMCWSKHGAIDPRPQFGNTGFNRLHLYRRGTIKSRLDGAGKVTNTHRLFRGSIIARAGHA